MCRWQPPTDCCAACSPWACAGIVGDSQLAWLEQRRACGARKSCLKQRYQERLDALQKVYDGIEKPI
jgi:hypothetical protein